MFSSEKGRPLPRAGVTYLVEIFCREANIKRFTPHDLRRTFGTTIIESGADVFTVQKLMGHESLDTTRIYDKRDEAAGIKAVQAMKRPNRDDK